MITEQDPYYRFSSRLTELTRCLDKTRVNALYKDIRTCIGLYPFDKEHMDKIFKEYELEAKISNS